MSEPLIDAPVKPEESLPRRLSFAGTSDELAGQPSSSYGGGHNPDDDNGPFLAVHLDLLCALYRDQPAPAEDPALFDDAIPRFLAARSALVRRRAEARTRDGVHGEAAKVAATEHARAQAAADKADGGRPRKRRKSLSPGRSPGLAGPSPLLFGAVAGAGPEPFALVARLLRQRAAAGRRRFRAAADPFRPLQGAVQRELHRLEARVAAARADRAATARAALEARLSTNSPLGKPVSAAGGSEGSDSRGTAAVDAAQDAEQESEIARATYQIRLWKLLARDMERILCD